MSRPENHDRTDGSTNTERGLVECRHRVRSLLLPISQDFSSTQDYFSRTFCKLAAFKYRGNYAQAKCSTHLPRYFQHRLVF